MVLSPIAVASMSPEGPRYKAVPDGARQDQEQTSLLGLGMLLPAAVLLTVFFVVPVAFAVYLGFTNLELVGPRSRAYELTGLANILRLGRDEVFWGAAGRTVVFLIAAAVVGQSVLGLGMALLSRRARRPIRSLVRSILVVAWVMPEVTAAFVWYAFTQAGGTLGLVTGQATTNFLVAAPLVVISLAAIWRNAAFSMLIFSAGLRTVPDEVTEAAEVEGAGWIRRLFGVTLPMLRSTIVTNFLLVTLLNLTQFTLIYAMTQGGPGNATTTLPIYVYRQAFTFFQLGYGTAIALVLLVIGALFSIMYVRSLRVRA